MEDFEPLLAFWIDEVGPKGWYKKDEAIDQRIRDNYQALWERAARGDRLGWTAHPSSTLALLILLDQFPRNMFRDDPRAFATDRQAVAVAKQAIDRGWDRRIAEPARQFFYLPLMHSECLEDQERCVRLLLERMPEDGADNLLHAKAHREVIRRFGRFPTRNRDLGRTDSERECHYLGNGGYGAVVNEMRVPG